jgi:hypothetical protein
MQKILLGSIGLQLSAKADMIETQDFFFKEIHRNNPGVWEIG